MKGYITGLAGINGMEPLTKESTDLIRHHSATIRHALRRAEKLNGLGFLPTGHKSLFSFAEMLKRYNTGISDDEIRAWVWYRRSIGIPMYGWEKYYIDGGTEESKLLVAITEAVIKDNHFRDLKIVPAGTVLGKRINKSHEYDKTVFQFFRDSEGIRMVDAKCCKEKGGVKTDPQKLHGLVMAGALFCLAGDLLPYPVYIYANMYDRTLELEKEKEHIIRTYGMEVYANHQRVIRESMPRSLTVTNPDAAERPKISALSKFARNAENGIDVSVMELREETGIVFKEKTSLKAAFSKWLFKLDKTEFTDTSAYDIDHYYLDGSNMPRNSTPEEKAEIRRNTRNEGEKLFERFLYEAVRFEDQQKIDVTWNRLYNGIPSIAYHKIPVGFECSARFQGFDFELRPAQREGIAFLELVGSGIVAFDVGVGKTITAIAEMANSMSSGKCKRPLVIVPNATYQNWIKELTGMPDKSGQFIEGLLTGTGITVNQWFNLGKEVTRGINLEKQVAEKTITLVTYEGFKKIGFGLDVAEDLFVELSNILMQSDHFKTRDAEVEYQKIREQVGVGLKDTIADIDKLGFDYIVMDEAHNAKNIFSSVKKDKSGRKRYGMSGATSDMGVKTFFLTNYLQRKYGRNVMLLTATPFTNSPLEIYSMLSLVAYHGLRQMNIENINDFFEQFVLETTEDVVGYDEKITQKDIVKSFNNRLLLQRLIYNHINYKTGEEAGVKRPRKINLPKVSEMQDGKIFRLPPSKQILTYLKMTLRQRENQNRIVSMFRETEGMRNPKIKSALILQGMGYSLNNAFHPALFDDMEPVDYMEFVSESPKIHYTCECIRTVRDYHLGRNEPVSGQVIYSNRGKDYFPYIKEYLEKEVGYRKAVLWNRMKIDEVEIIDSGVSPIKKENIKNAFLDGACKVVIGTATIREGINLQRKGTVIYNLYPDWNPTDIRQLEGRIWRQKNEYGFVRIAMPLVQDSMDVFVFQKLEEKTYRINDIWYKGDRGNVLDLESLDPEEVKFALLTDINAIAASVVKKEVKVQERKIAAISDKIETLREYVGWKNKYQMYKDRLIVTIKRFFQQFENQPHIRSKPDGEALKAMEKEQRDRVKADIEFYDEVIRFFEKTPVTDTELKAMARRFSRLFPYFDNILLDYFVEAHSVVVKAEKTLLASKGFTASDNIDEAIKSYQNDLEEAENHLKYLNSEEHLDEVRREVRRKKNEMSVAGKSIPERVEEFAGLNHLLSYKFADVPADGSIPKTEKPPEASPQQTDDRDEDEDLLIAEAEMELLNLKF